MAWNPNSRKHKATHKGYKGKPPLNQVSALLGLYSDNLPQPNTKQPKIKEPTQTQIKFPI